MSLDTLAKPLPPPCDIWWHSPIPPPPPRVSRISWMAPINKYVCLQQGYERMELNIYCQLKKTDDLIKWLLLNYMIRQKWILFDNL